MSYTYHCCGVAKLSHPEVFWRVSCTLLTIYGVSQVNIVGDCTVDVAARAAAQ